MKLILLSEWPLFKDALLIASAIPLSVIFPLGVIEWTLNDPTRAGEDELPFRF